MPDEIEKLRAWQLAAAASRIGPLLDRWEHMSNDVKGSLRSDDEQFCKLLDALNAAWISEPPMILADCFAARSCQHIVCICEGDPTRPGENGQ